MNKSFEIIRQTRKTALEFVKDLSIAQLNTIPAGFNNNIIWNLGHMVAAQQGVCYRRAGLGLIIESSFFDMYKPESKPERFIDATEFETIKNLLSTIIDKLEADYNNHIFTNYPAWVTHYGVNIDTIEDAITFLPFHEGLHFGYIMALKRAIS